MIENFQYHAFGSGVMGHFTLPFDEIVPVQASAALPASGGFSTVRVDNFNFRNILSFRSATTMVSGSLKQQPDRQNDTFDATATVVIEGFNLLNMFTADRMVARIASSHPRNGTEPRITPIGSHFENLKIAGVELDVDLAVDVFSGNMATNSAFRAACRDEKQRSQINPFLLAGTPANIVPCTLVRGLKRRGATEPAPKDLGLGADVEYSRNSVKVRGFGTIRLAELTITQCARHLTMLRFELGCSPTGSGGAGSVEGNGTGW